MDEEERSGSTEEEGAATTSAKEGGPSSPVGERIGSGALAVEEVSLFSLTGEREGGETSMAFSFSFSRSAGEAAVIGTRESVEDGFGRGVAVGVAAF